MPIKIKDIKIEDIGGAKLKSSNSQKLLGLHVDSNFGWNTHIGEISNELKKRIGILSYILDNCNR